ncbi:hypothetical protein NLI96_g7114 [Meripilus lineatus]|uniref:Uncharacterized protein n=1 Tax=Meripilus lineatus TaxID=2056292 RepID=A0AAD5V052_9APHY|nr:hypothetical protein NLI96_g7114 [Physisporinus lineatus]
MSLLPIQFEGDLLAAVDENFFHMTSKLLAAYPGVVHAAISTGVFAHLLSGHIPDLMGELSLEVSLSGFLDKVELLPNFRSLELFRESLWQRFFEFVQGSPPQEVQGVLEHLLYRCISRAALANGSHGPLASLHARNFLIGSAQVHNAHSEALQTLFPQEVHRILGAQPDLSDWSLGELFTDDITVTTSQLKRVLPGYAVIPPPMPLFRNTRIRASINTGLVASILLKFVPKSLMESDPHGETRWITQGCLFNMALVSHYWNTIAVETLYSHPTLFQGDKAWVFLRTMWNCPELAKMVLSLRMEPRDGWWSPKEKNYARLAIESVLHCCHKLNRLSVTTTVASYYADYSEQWTHPNRLRALMLGNPIPADSLTFPELEVLCMKRCILPYDNFSSLPRLRSLRIHQWFIDNAEVHPVDFQAVFPNIHNFDLLASSCSVLAMLPKPLPVDDVLDGILEFPWNTLFQKTDRTQPSEDQGLRHLTIGTLDDHFDMTSFAIWTTGSALESLTLIITPSLSTRNPLQSITSFLSNLGPCSLRTLRIMYDADLDEKGSYLDAASSFFNSIYFFSDLLHIEIEVITYRAYTPH